MGSRCYGCGEKFGRCYEHAGNCPDGCTFGPHDCPGELDAWFDHDGVYPVGEWEDLGVEIMDATQ